MIEQLFYSVFGFIYLYEDYFTDKYLKEQKLEIDKQDNKILKSIYKTFNMKSVWIFSDFKKAVKKVAILMKIDVVEAAMKLVNIIKK
jgi:hypothetical protein